jgi:hypothetical protein
MRTKTKTARLNVRVSSTLHEELIRLQKDAKREDLSDYVRLILEQHVAKKTKKAA